MIAFYSADEPSGAKLIPSCSHGRREEVAFLPLPVGVRCCIVSGAMAVFSEIWDTREGFMDEYFAQLSAVEAERERENHAAVQIQRLFRGFRTRKHIKKLQYVSDAG